MTEELQYNAVRFEDATEQLCALWREAFGDSDEYIDAFFDCCDADTCLHTLSKDGSLLSALYALPMTLKAGGKTLRAAYLYAVATFKEHRSKGYMTELMMRTHEKLQQQGFDAVLLLPADDSLAGYYTRFGYSFCASRGCRQFEIPDGDVPSYPLEECDDCTLEMLKFARECTDGCHSALLPDVALLSMNIASCRMAGGGAHLLRLGGEIAALAFTTVDREGPLVLSAMVVDDEMRRLILALLCRRFGTARLRCMAPDADGTPFAMIKMLGAAGQLSNIHMELMLDK